MSGATVFLLCGIVGALASLCEGAGAHVEGVIDGTAEDTTEGLLTPVVAGAAEGWAEALEAERVVT